MPVDRKAIGDEIAGAIKNTFKPEARKEVTTETKIRGSWLTIFVRFQIASLVDLTPILKMFTHLESAAWINGYDEPDMPCIVLKGNIESATAVEVVFVLKDLAT